MRRLRYEKLQHFTKILTEHIVFNGLLCDDNHHEGQIEMSLLW